MGAKVTKPSRDALGPRRERLGEQQPPPAAREDQPQAAVELGAAPRRQQLRDLALELGPRHLAPEPQVRGRALEPVEVVGEGERRARRRRG